MKTKLVSQNKQVFFTEDLKRKIKDGLVSTLKREADSILHLIDNFPTEAISVVEKILLCKGHVVFSGMGKSGLIGKKLAATFSSMGMPSVFLHPAEAIHGDLGSVRSDDLIILLSKSASGEEVVQMVPILKSQGNTIVLFCCDEGVLTKLVDFSVKLSFKKEACELNLAPTSSSTLMLAFGDALAIVSSSLRGFSKNDFARFHPGGSLGKNLLLKIGSLVNDIDPLPLVYPSTPFYEVLVAMTAGKRGVGIVVDYQGQPLGIITDGDLRRACESGAAVFEKKALDIMSPDPKTISVDIKALTALELMEDHNITSLIVVENERIVGLVHIHDIIKAGIKRT